MLSQINLKAKKEKKASFGEGVGLAIKPNL